MRAVVAKKLRRQVKIISGLPATDRQLVWSDAKHTHVINNPVSGRAIYLQAKKEYKGARHA